MMDEAKDNSQVGALLQINNLDFRIPPSLSVAVSRAHAKYEMSDQKVGNGKQIQFVMPTGSHYVDFKNSYIKFKLSTTLIGESKTNTLTFNSEHLADQGDPDASFGNPGALAMFSEMRYTHSSGTVIDEVSNFLSSKMHQQCAYQTSSDWQRSVGSMFGMGNTSVRGESVLGAFASQKQIVDYHNFNSIYDPADAPDGGGAAAKWIFTSGGAEKEFIIPLSVFSDVFNQEKLAPSFLVAGSRLTLKLDTPTRAFVSSDDDIKCTSYEVTDCAVYLEQYQLTDAIAKTLSAISASSGLEYPFEAWEHNSLVTAMTNSTIQVTRALSRANNVMLHTRIKNHVDKATKSSIIAAKLKPDTTVSYQVQLGGQYMPTQQVEGALEGFQQSLITERKYHSLQQTDLNFYQNYCLGGAGVQRISLESSSTLQQSGAALSAQRVLLFNIRRDWGDIVAPGDREFVHVLWVSYVRLATIFLDSIIVRS